MPLEFPEHLRAPEAQPASNRGAGTPEKVVGTDMPDEPEAIPPAGLMRRRRHIWFWLAVALLLGAFIALILVALMAD
ncbi:MAG TPA: hypothetical protein VLL56_05155 [Terriglobia bacterium]|nr:hypothetical protein [Terriglobia bacterium]